MAIDAAHLIASYGAECRVWCQRLGWCAHKHYEALIDLIRVEFGAAMDWI